MKRSKHHSRKPISRFWLILVLLLSVASSLRAEITEPIGRGLSEVDVSAAETAKALGQPKSYQLSHYQKLLGKAPFGKVPVDAPAPIKMAEAPSVEEKKLAIAAVSVVEGKPQVYLIDLKTRAYQKINTEVENESKIRLVELSEESNPRDVVAKVMIDGRLSTVKYDTGILDTKPTLAAKRKGRSASTTNQRTPPRPNTLTVTNTSRTNNVTQQKSVARSAAEGIHSPQSVNRALPVTGGQSPVPGVRSIQDQRRLSAVPRRRVIVPGRSATQP